MCRDLNPETRNWPAAAAANKGSTHTHTHTHTTYDQFFLLKGDQYCNDVTVFELPV
jgi:hypothetical protein